MKPGTAEATDMPTYEYACKECGDHLEVVQSFSDDPLTECPACHGQLRKVFSPIGISFKGQGFYKTDSRNGSASKAASDSSSSDSSSSDSTTTGTKTSDAKTDSKASTSDSSISTTTSQAKSA